MEKISIITICYNCQEVIETTLRSVVSQTFANKEYVVIDGGSTDNTVNIISRYRNDIDIFVSEPDNGIYDAINKGIGLASGAWIVCMNAGDVFVDDEVLQKIADFPKPEEKQFLYSDYWLKSPQGELRHMVADRDNGQVLHQSSIYRKNLHAKYGKYLVTKPYIVSDLLFFLTVPKELFLKVPYEISVNTMGGVSEKGTWCTEGALSLQVVFRIQSIHAAYIQYMKKRIVAKIPFKLKYCIRQIIKLMNIYGGKYRKE